MTKPLSPAAAAVLKEFEDSWTADPFEMDIGALAAALRAAAERLGYDSVYDIVCDSGEPNYRVDVADLLAIADELEGDEPDL